MNLLKLIFSLAIVLFSNGSFACLNFFVIDSSGNRHQHDQYPPSSFSISTKYDIQYLKKIEKEIKIVPNIEKYKYISNYCALLIKLGRSKDAIYPLEKLVKEKPYIYEITANLAVAYEINGQLDSALTYLKKSMLIYPKSHRESEWFHLRILEAALEIRDKKINPEDLSILKISNDTSKIIGYQIGYQLNERVPLTNSSNKLLCKVLEESADYYLTNISTEWAIELYATAIGYSTSKSVANRLWSKIYQSRAKLIMLKNQGKMGSVSKYLYKNKWKRKIAKRIKKWMHYRVYIYEKEIVTTF